MIAIFARYLHIVSQNAEDASHETPDLHAESYQELFGLGIEGASSLPFPQPLKPSLTACED